MTHLLSVIGYTLLTLPFAAARGIGALPPERSVVTPLADRVGRRGVLDDRPMAITDAAYGLHRMRGPPSAAVFDRAPRIAWRSLMFNNIGRATDGSEDAGRALTAVRSLAWNGGCANARSCRRRLAGGKAKGVNPAR
jgi:hypothetical protein